MSLRGDFPSSALANPIVRSEAEGSTALLVCTFILINSQITVGLFLISLAFLSADFPQGNGHIALLRKEGHIILFTICPWGPTVRSQGVWLISNVTCNKYWQSLTCICSVNNGNNFKRSFTDFSGAMIFQITKDRAWDECIKECFSS